MHPQLPLRIGFTQRATLANFIVGENEELAVTLSDWLTCHREEIFYLWGLGGCGRTHLLSAACDAAESAGRSWAYLSLADGTALDPRRRTAVDPNGKRVPGPERRPLGLLQHLLPEGHLSGREGLRDDPV